MSWDPAWDEIFQVKPTWGMYPQEELVRFVATHYYGVANRRDVKILELGCGPGAGSSWYVAREGFRFYGIDGSPTAIEKAKDRFQREGIPGEFAIGDIEQLPWERDFFDCVIDVACLQHNSEAATSRIIGEVHRVLRDGGRHFSFAAAAGSWGDGHGIRVDDTSFTDVTEGPYMDMNMGLVRFATRESLVILYAQFRDLHVERSIRTVNDQEHDLCHWVIACQK